jgi:hypothetical protein
MRPGDTDTDSNPITVNIPLRIIDQIRSIAGDAKNPLIPYIRTDGAYQMLDLAYAKRGEALERIEKLIGLVPDLGLQEALRRWRDI